MSIMESGWKRVVILLFIFVIIYSFLPLIPFWFMEGAGPGDNNEANIEKLKDNKGAYFSFIVIGDMHCGLLFNDAAALKNVWNINREDRFRKTPIDFVLSIGDVTLNGKLSDYTAFKKIQKLIKFPLITAIGNHDERKLFEKFCGKKEFAFVDRNSYFIVLDNEGGNLSDEQFKWVEEQLKEGKKHTHTFVVMHKPPFDPYQQDWYNMDNSPWAYRFRKLCAEYGVNTVFTGHRHMFKDENFDGVNYVVTGGGGMLIELPKEEGGYLHYVRVMVNHDYVTFEVRKVSPPLWEYLTYYAWKEVVYWFHSLYGSGYLFGANTRIEPIRETRLNNKEYWSWE
ncbi:MAG: metallophosphoesterase [Candidatus Omnitrophica bacterium]|nr:metallophosphoesterase [Candidatus Omnitrophota bacterium]